MRERRAVRSSEPAATGWPGLVPVAAVLLESGLLCLQCPGPGCARIRDDPGIHADAYVAPTLAAMVENMQSETAPAEAAGAETSRGPARSAGGAVAPLRDDVRFLGALLGDTVREQAGQEVFDLMRRPAAPRSPCVARRRTVTRWPPCSPTCPPTG